MACCGRKGKPPIKKQISNVALAAGRIANNALKGKNILVSKDKRDKRLNACKECDEYDGSRCNECGCFVKAKTWLTTELCLLGKWVNL